MKHEKLIITDCRPEHEKKLKGIFGAGDVVGNACKYEECLLVRKGVISGYGTERIYRNDNYRDFTFITADEFLKGETMKYYTSDNVEIKVGDELIGAGTKNPYKVIGFDEDRIICRNRSGRYSDFAPSNLLSKPPKPKGFEVEYQVTAEDAYDYGDALLLRDVCKSWQTKIKKLNGHSVKIKVEVLD